MSTTFVPGIMPSPSSAMCSFILQTTQWVEKSSTAKDETEAQKDEAICLKAEPEFEPKSVWLEAQAVPAVDGWVPDLD